MVISVADSIGALFRIHAVKMEFKESVIREQHTGLVQVVFVLFAIVFSFSSLV